MPFIYADHIKCKFCKQTQCEFLQVKARGVLYLTRRCKACVSEYNQNYYYANRKERIAHSIKWARDNRERINLIRRRYRANKKLKQIVAY